MRLVLDTNDTNVAVSGLLWQGNPGKLIDAAQAGSLILCARAPLLAELHDALGREKFAKHLQVRTAHLSDKAHQRPLPPSRSLAAESVPLRRCPQAEESPQKPDRSPW